MTNPFSVNDIEILISTMNKTSLDFLELLFPYKHFSEFNILIINQTISTQIVVSNYKNIRVINSFEKGLSKSRNLALENCSKKIALIADDDVVYCQNFDNEISKAFNKVSNQAIITFNHQRIGNQKPQNSSINSYEHTLKTIEKVCSIEIAFQVASIQKHQLKFDEHFGLGATFETAEENLFLREALQKKLKMSFNPAVIVTHPLITSGKKDGSDKLIFARAALYYKTKGRFGYLTLVKHIYHLVKNKNITLNKSYEKLKIGLSGIKKFKKIQKFI